MCKNLTTGRTARLQKGNAMTWELTKEWAQDAGVANRPTFCRWCKTDVGMTNGSVWVPVFFDAEDQLLLCRPCAVELENAIG